MKHHLGDIIYKLSEARRWCVKELAARVPGTTPSTFSKIRGGDFSRISDQRLEHIAEALAPDDPNTRAAIICAYLRDMCPRDYHHLVDIRPRAEDPGGSFDMGIHKTLQKLAEASAKDDTFLAHLKSLEGLAEAILAKAPT